MNTPIKVARVAELPAGSGKMVEVNGHVIALFNVDGEYFAIDNVCPHAGGPLAEGELNGNVVTCPWHGAKFDVTNGDVLGPPAQSSVRTFSVTVDHDDVLIEVE